MPPKPRAKQNRKPAQRRRKLSIINLQMIVDPSAEHTATAVDTAANTAATAALPPAFGSMSVPTPDTCTQHTAQGHVDQYMYARPSSTSHSASSALPSPSITDEASPASAYAQGELYDQPPVAPAETEMYSAHEDVLNQNMNDQNDPTFLQMPIPGSDQPTAEGAPLHTAMLLAGAMITSRIKGLDGNTSIETANNTEKSRYYMLQSACLSFDPVFVILHQQYSLWVVDRSAAYATLLPVPPDSVDIAFTELYNMLNDDKKMTGPQWLWFSKYPRFSGVVGLERIYIQVKDFISTLAMNWPGMKQNLLSQRRPVMAYQIREGLGCMSTYIANIVFTYVRRAIGVPDGQLTLGINRLFAMDIYQERSFGENKVSWEERDRLRSSMMASYMKLIQEARKQAHLPALGETAANPSQRLPAPPPTNHTSINIRRDADTNSLDSARQQQHLPQHLQGPPQCQMHATMNHQPHAAPSQTSHQHPQQLDDNQSVPLPAIRPLPQAAGSFQNQPRNQAQPPPQQQQQQIQQSGLRYPPDAIPYRQPLHPLIVPRPPEQRVIEHPNLLPPIISPRDDTESTSPAVMSQHPNHNSNRNISYSPSHHHPHPVHPAHSSHPLHHYQQQQHHHHHHHDHHSPAHIHSHSPHTQPMPHPIQTTQGPLPPPWQQEPQVQSRGDGGHQHQTPSPLPSNAPSPYLSHPHHQAMLPTQALQGLQTPSTPQVLQAPWTPQALQGSQAPRPLMAPEAPMTPQPHHVQTHHAPAQVLQAPSMHYVQSHIHPQNQRSASESSPASTRSQPHPHFTTHVLPPSDYPYSPHGWTSLQAGLHLTHQRSPRRVSSSLNRDPDSKETRFYQFFSKFVVEPKELEPNHGIRVFEFDVAQEDLNRLSLTSTSPGLPSNELATELPVSRYFNNSYRYRIRLCKGGKEGEQTTFDSATWARTPTHWPPGFFLQFNDKPIHVRRKQHFHYDLPIELTDDLVKGKNTIKVNLPGWSSNLNESTVYFIAVELVVTLDHDSVWDLVISEPHTSVEVTKSEISRRLQRLETDEIVIKSGSLTVAVADSFSSKLFDMPVRGRHCLHVECIDLGNWLKSRPSKWPHESGEPTMVDDWACPICGMDARPCNLRVDDFFVEIREKILKSDLSNVKKIELFANGTWAPIEEVDEDDGSTDKDDVQKNSSGQGAFQGMAIDATDTMHY